MEDLRLVGVHDDGTHLLLEAGGGAGAEGPRRFRLPLDDALRAAVRQDRIRLGQLQIELEGVMRPRDVQTMVRAGATAEEVAERSGWSVDKVRRYEGPILAERAHVADQGRGVRVRTRSGGESPTLGARVSDRMRARDVDPTTSRWDAWRDAEVSQWTICLHFVAGGRERRALWAFDPATRTVTARDDEARWLSEDESPTGDSPIPGTALPTRVTTTVYDVEAEGGVTRARTGVRSTGSRSAPATPPHDDAPLDLMSAMRERSAARGRRSRRGKAGPTDVPAGPTPDDALPITELAYDPAVHGLPPAAHPAAGVEDVREAESSGDGAGDGAGDVVDEVVTEPVADVAVGRREASGESGDRGSSDPGGSEHRGDAGGSDHGGSDHGGSDHGGDAGESSASDPGVPPPLGRVRPLSAVDEPSRTLHDALVGADDQTATVADAEADGVPDEGDTETGADSSGNDTEADGGSDDNADAHRRHRERVVATSRAARPARPEEAPARRNGRASVPSWDDIMFGSRRD